MRHRVAERDAGTAVFSRSTNNGAFPFIVADPIRFGTKFLLMLFCGVPCQYDLRRSVQFATDSLKRLTFQVVKFFGRFLGLAETRRRKILSTR